jgi:hypothetical protein
MRNFAIPALAVALLFGPAVAAASATPEASAAPIAATQDAATAAPTAATGAPQSAAPTTIAEKVAADWPKYDTGNKGNLTRVEFGKWMADLRTATSQSAPTPQWLKTAFTQTDTDKNGKVTAAELTTFLTAGA